MTIKNKAFIFSGILIFGIFVVGILLERQQSREAVAIRKRCLAVAEDTREIFDETSTYPTPLFFKESTQVDFEQNQELVIGIKTFIACIENDHAFSKTHPINDYRKDARTALSRIEEFNQDIYSKICSQMTAEGSMTDYPIVTSELVEWCKENRVKREL